MTTNESIPALERSKEETGVRGFQERVADAHVALFHDDPTDIPERRDRFYEEATETAQALGMTEDEAHQLVAYTFSRPAGDPQKEIGAAALTLASLCVVGGWDMMECAEADLAALVTPEKIAKVRAKRATRHGRGPLPGLDPSAIETPPLHKEGEAVAALRDAIAWIVEAPHDEHCFTNDPNPDACRCVCGKDSILDRLYEAEPPDDKTYEDAPAPVPVTITDGWRPIETAPKDGSRVLCWNDEWQAPESGCLYGPFWAANSYAADHRGWKYQPTHWMPLPPNPNTTEQKGE